MKSAYIHIPFCNHLCSYCDFAKVLYNENQIFGYLDALKNEINEYYEDEILNTLYIGGGTPSCLRLKELEKLFEVLSVFKLNKEYEYTFECNIADINETLLNILKENKVNRLSIGIESFNEENLKFLERKNTFKEVQNKIKLAREKGFYNINLDLMYALPHETICVLKKDLALLLKLKPEHISTYSLIIEEHTKLKINNTKNIAEDLDYKMYKYICKKLKNKGYIHYEVSNFALNGFESKHNLVYWNNEEYYGFGLGSHGYKEGFRYANSKSITDYLKHVYHTEENFLTYQDMMDNELMLGLRKMNGVNIILFKEKYQHNIEDVFPIKPLLKSKDLILKNNNLYINPDKIYIMNEILLKLI